ncbi:MAG TPA: radical SAM protein [Geobacter sp.]|nr:radical SAM protein [Geobacter sp.]
MPLSAVHETLISHGLLPPKTLTVAVTEACNQRCAHCWKSAGTGEPACRIPAGTLCEILGEFRALGGEGVRFTGGEPLCHPQWLELLRFAVAEGFGAVSLQTNGVLLDEGRVAALAGIDFPGLSIQVSLDGATAATHDLVRGEGAFLGVMRGMEQLARGGLISRVSIFCTEMRHNLEEIPALLALAESLGVTSVTTGMLVSCGRAAGGALVRPPEPSQYLGLLQRYRDDASFRELYRRVGRVAALEWGNCSEPRGGACNFLENPYLTARGVLYPCVLCHADPYSVEGVLEKGLAAAIVEGAPIWSELLAVSRRRPDEIADCRECGERLTCAGGCLGRAWGSFGDIMAPDDRCAVRREIARHKAR